MQTLVQYTENLWSRGIMTATKDYFLYICFAGNMPEKVIENFLIVIIMK